MMSKIFHSRIKIAIYNESIKSNLKETLDSFAGYVGHLRSMAEVEFSKSISPLGKKYAFVHYLNAVDDSAGDVAQRRRELMTKFSPESFLAAYANQTRSINILLGKCSEAFLFTQELDGPELDENIKSNVTGLLSQIFLKIMKKHQDSMNGNERTGSSGTDLVNICLEPLRKAEFLCRHHVQLHSENAQRWRNLINNSNSGNEHGNEHNKEHLHQIIEKRILKKKMKKINSQILNFILDDEIKYKGTGIMNIPSV